MKLNKLKMFFDMGYVEFKKYKKLNILAVIALILCFIVFFVSLLIYKVTPLLVLYLSQSREGPYDVTIYSKVYYNNYYNFWRYKKVKEQNFKNINLIGRNKSLQYFIKKDICFKNISINHLNLRTCHKYQNLELYRINLKEEQDFGLFKNIKESSLQNNNIVINKTLSDLLELKKGDKIVIKYNINYVELEKIYIIIKSTNKNFIKPKNFVEILIPLEFIVSDVVDDTKFFGTFYLHIFKAFISNINFNKYLANQILKINNIYYDYTKIAKDYSNIKDDELINTMYISFKNRIDIYNHNKYSDVRNSLITNIGEVNNYWGNNSYTFELNILKEQFQLQEPAAIMKMISNVLITLLVIGGVYLLYNIFILNSDFKIYEIGMFRTFGITKKDILYLFSAQGSIIYIFSLIPSYLIILAIVIFINIEFKKLISYDSYILPSLKSFYLINVIIYFMPIVSWIIPIKNLMKKSLIESLNKNRSKINSIIVDITNKRKYDFFHYFTFAFFSIAIGSFLYYVFPVAIINLNYDLIFIIIFLLILIILVGFGLFSTNLQNILEKIFYYIFLIFEKKYIKKIVKMNLTSHKISNKKTSLIFAIALTFIQFVYVAFISLTVINKNFRFNKIGSKIYMINQNFSTVSSWKKYHGKYLTFAWVSRELKYDINKNTEIKNWGKTINYDVNIHAISPNYIDFIDNYRFLDIPKDEFLSKNISYSQFLYTKDGHNTCLMSSFIYDKLFLSGNGKFVVTLDGKDDRNFIVSKKFFSINQMRSTYTNTIFISLTKLNEITENYTKDDIQLNIILIKPKNISQEKLYKRLRKYGYNVYFISGEKEYNKFISIFKLILIGGTFWILIICYLSLNISMISNINKEKKDIAILLNLGLKKREIYRIFFYEAFILIVVSSISGILMGNLLGSLLWLNLSIITPITVKYLLFWEIIVLIILFGLISAFISTFIPLKSLLKKNTVNIMKEIN